ncbi:ABA4-like family protein [Plantactinospora sonchi]|uniref:ABA4-like family protein n=1 Tax=Plantactinospora sonchi TaxID=1544735 RepID=A0ABU7RNJ7_9ACTN
MTDFLFNVVFPLAAPFWALMILAPGWSWTRRIVGSPWIVAPPLVVYALLAVPHLDLLWSAVSQPTLDGLAGVLAVPAVAAAGWAHFIAFDLFVGRWMYLDSRERGFPALVMAPLLVLTILLAPLGALGYLLVRHLRPGRVDGGPADGPEGGAVGATDGGAADGPAGGGSASRRPGPRAPRDEPSGLG